MRPRVEARGGHLPSSLSLPVGGRHARQAGGLKAGRCCQPGGSSVGSLKGISAGNSSCLHPAGRSSDARANAALYHAANSPRTAPRGRPCRRLARCARSRSPRDLQTAHRGAAGRAKQPWLRGDGHTVGCCRLQICREQARWLSTRSPWVAHLAVAGADLAKGPHQGTGKVKLCDAAQRVVSHEQAVGAGGKAQLRRGGKKERVQPQGVDSGRRRMLSH